MASLPSPPAMPAAVAVPSAVGVGAATAAPSGAVLSLAHSVVAVCGPLAVAAASSASATSAVSAVPRHTARLHPAWMERLGWSVGDGVLVCRRAPSSPASSEVVLHCGLARLLPTDPTLAGNWTTADLSCGPPSSADGSSGSGASVSFVCSTSSESWARAVRTEFTDLPQVELADREARLQAHLREAALALAAAKAAAAAAAAALKTPVKAKTSPKIMQPPSAASIAKAEAAGPKMPSLETTLAASARLLLRLDAQAMPHWKPAASVSAHVSGQASSSDSSAVDEVDSSIYLLSLRQKTAPVPATRIVLQLLGDDDSTALRPADLCTKEEEMELAAMVKRFLNRCFVCSDAVIDVRDLAAPRLRAWKRLRIKEISPEGEICQMTRSTHVILDTSSATAASASSIAAPSLSAALVAASSPSSTPLHPALAALHSLLLPPLLYPEAFKHLAIDTPRGLLLSGPPGVGKTYSVASVCRALKVELFLLDGAAVYGGEGGEGGGVAGAAEETLRNKFAQAQACPRPTVLFIDEIDVLCPHRTNEAAQLSNRLVAQLLSLMDGLENRGHLLIVGATNHPNALDAALRRPGRFDRELRLEPPNVEQRLDLLKTYTKSMPLEEDAEAVLKELAITTVGYVAADLAALVREAAQHALQWYQQQAKVVDVTSDSTAVVISAPTTLPTLVTRSDFAAAQIVVPASSLRDGGSSRAARKDGSTSAASFANIGGLEDVKHQLRQALEWPLLHADTFKTLGLSPPRGLLLYGPPGCAKTSLVRAVASASHASFLQLDTAALYSCYVGEAERILRSLFTRARANRPCVLFLDELDAMVAKRDMGTGSSGGSDAHSLEARILSTLLNEMDGMVSSQGLLVVAATNRLDMIDEALLRPGRFDQIIYVPPPDAASRLAILRLHSHSMLASPDAPETIEALKALADGLERYTGADLANLCRETALETLRRNIQQEKVLVSDLVRVASTSSASLTADQMLHYAAGRGQSSSSSS